MKWIGKHPVFSDLMIGSVLLTPPDNQYEYELTLPDNDGNAGQVLTTDGNGLLTWTTVSSGSGTVTSITPAADSGTGTAITTTGTLTVAGGTNVTTAVSGTTITVNATDTKVALNGTTVNGIATYASADTLDIESTLTYASNTLTIGLPTSSSAVITTPTSLAGQAGDRFIIACADSGSGTDIAAGRQTFSSGIGTGSEPGGMYTFLGAPAANLAGGTGTSRPDALFQIYVEAGAANSSFTKLYDVNDIRNYFTTQCKASGNTILATVDNASHNADLTIVADGAVQIQSTDASNDITLNSAGEIELNADGGNIDFKDNTTHFAKLTHVNNRGSLDLYGGTTGGRTATGQVNFYEDTGYATNHITLKAFDSAPLSSDKEVQLPNADGIIQLQGENTGQVVHVQIKDFGSYLFYLFHDDNWYSAGSTTLALLGNSSTPGNLSSGNSKYQGRIASYTAPSACTLKKLCFSFYWSSSVVNSADIDFGFSKFTPIAGGTGATITMNAITATNNDGLYTENAPYYKTFDFSGANATLAAGDSFAFHMRTTGGQSSQRVLVYGQAILYLELD